MIKEAQEEAKKYREEAINDSPESPYSYRQRAIIDEENESKYTIVSGSTPPPPAPKFKDTLEAAFRKYNIFISAYDYLNDERDKKEDYEDNYNPIEEGLLDDIPEAHWDAVLQQTSRRDAEITRQKIFKELRDTDTLDRSGWVARTSTVIGASVLDPLILVPFAATAKYGKLSKGIMMNALNMAKVAGPVAALHNAAIYGAKETDGVKEWAHDTLMETFFAAGLGGALGAFASKNVKGHMNNAKAFFKSVENDIDIKWKLTADGQPDKLVARAQPGAGVGADAVKNVQSLLDRGDVYFKDSPWVRKAFSWSNPMVEGLTSKFKTVRGLIGEMFPHSFETAAGEVSNIGGHSAYAFLQDMRARHNTVMISLNKAWIESMGIKGPAGTLQASVKSLTGKFQTWTQFLEEIGTAYRKGGKGYSPIIKREVDNIKRELFDPMTEELKRYYPNFQEHEYTNITNYLMRVYDKNKITANPEKFLEMVETYFNKRNDKLMEIRKPLDTQERILKTTNDSIADLKTKLKTQKDILSKEEVKRLNDQIKELNAMKKISDDKLVSLKATIDEQIRSGEIGLDLYEGKVRLSPEQVNEINKIKKPITDAEEKITALEKELSTAEKAEEKSMREEIKKLKEEIKMHNEKILQEIENETIPKELYRLTAKGAKLLDVNELPTLQRILSQDEIKLASQSIRDNILQQSEEQISGQMFEQATSGGTNPLKSRVFLANDAEVMPWLVNDIGILSGIYTENVGRHVFMEKLMQSYGTTLKEGEKHIAELIKADYKALEKDILKKPATDARGKELNKLRNEFEKSLKYINNMTKTFMGQYAERGTVLSRVAEATKKASVATYLGNVPILMLNEFVVPLFRFCFKNYIQDGVLGSFSRLTHFKETMLAKGANYSGYVKGYFADAGLCCNRYLGHRMQQLQGVGKQYFPKTIVERTIDNLASISQNLSLANYIMDVQEFMVASMSEARMIRSISKYRRGEKLLKEEIDHLDRIKMNPVEWGERVVNQFNKYGKEIDGSFVSNFHMWDDLEVARQFRMSIHNDVRQIVLLPHIADKPLWLQNPILGTMLQFLSYIFDANQKFTIPLLTKTDNQMMVGALAMMGVSAWVAPLRQLSRGDEPDLSPKVLMNEAMINSGLFGFYIESVFRMNRYMDLPLINKIQPDRFKREAFTGFGGPAVNSIEFMFSAIGALANGEMNQREYKRMLRLFLGASYNWYTAQLFNKAAESLSPYRTRGEAKKAKEFE